MDRKYFSAILLLIALGVIVAAIGTGIFYYQKFLEEERTLASPPPPPPAPPSLFPEAGPKTTP